MDVHLDNWRLRGRIWDIIVHLILPESLLEAHNFPINGSDPSAFAQTKFLRDGRVSEFERVWARRVRNNGEFFGALALSVPLLLDAAKSVNPLNTLTLKIYDPDTATAAFIHFFYINLLKGHDQALPPISGTEENGVSTHVDPVSAILDTRPTAATPSAFTYLADLLCDSHSRPQRHHTALEDPGQVRGVSSQDTSGTPEVVEDGRKVPRLHLNSTLLAPKPDRVEKCRHALSGAAYFVCYYQALPSRVDDRLSFVTDDSSTSGAAVSDPLAPLMSEAAARAAVQDALVDSLQEAAAGNALSQKLPVAIPKNAALLNDIKDHFLEACFRIRNSLDETCAWVKATVAAGQGQRGLWADFYKLWEPGTPKLGVCLSAALLGGANCNKSEATLWTTLFQDPRIAEVAFSSSSACLLVDHTLSAQLILPGGFVIKGYYTLSRNSVAYFTARWLK